MCSIEKGYDCICKSDSLQPKHNACHGIGGVPILYKTAIQFYSTSIENTNSERELLVLKLRIQVKVHCFYVQFTYHPASQLKSIKKK